VIGDKAFQGCSRLTSVYCEATTPPNLLDFSGMTFKNNAPDLKIYVPKFESFSLQVYKSVEYWKENADIIEEYDFDNE
jgi:hypothetical protein